MATGSTIQEKNYDNLVIKYSKLFSQHPMEPFPMFGWECDIGWYDLLEQLLEHIDHYFEHKYKGVPEGFTIVQIKEKFGGLRFYVHGGDDTVYEIIRFAEALSYRTCESCGSNQNIMRSKGWIVTACKTCIETKERLKYPDGRDREWVSV